MEIFNSDLEGRAMLEKPVDAREKAFWIADRINYYRGVYGTQCLYDSLLRELAETLEEFYTDWLRQRDIKEDLASYQIIVLPYVSFRFLAARGRKEVDIWRSNAGQIHRLVDGMLEEVLQIPDDPIVRAMVKESVLIFLKFMKEFREVRMQ